MSISKEKRTQVHNMLEGKCGYCGKAIAIKEMQVDHKIPRCLLDSVLINGIRIKEGDLSNLMPSCRRCNHYKRGETIEGFRFLLKDLHKRVSSTYIAKVAIDFGMLGVKPFDGTFYFERQSKTHLL